MKRLKITESQLNRLMGESKKVSINDIIDELKSSFSCSGSHKGSNFKTLVSDTLYRYGFKEVIVSFLKRDEYKDLVYLIYTEKMILKISTESGISPKDKPCLTIKDISVFNLTK